MIGTFLLGILLVVYYYGYSSIKKINPFYKSDIDYVQVNCTIDSEISFSIIMLKLFTIYVLFMFMIPLISSFLTYLSFYTLGLILTP